MAVFTCKMCGGSLEIQQDSLIAVCEYCGTKQTLPRLDNEQKMHLYDRANHFRRNNEYDKAMAMYETLVGIDSTDAETYWSLVLCRYGIEYVEDPASGRRVPTVNRAQYTSIYADEDYLSALRYADESQREIYQAEAKQIDEIQKGILEVSQKEAPFDVFICYKETDASGGRTPDSVLADELYRGLTDEGFRVFFSRITLEDKLGTAYEPYIFAALHSAKVMVVLGTRPEYFNAVWVKNEWSRYVSLIKNGEKKVLIPAFRDMDPYDLPVEFAHLQAQDMSKLGFMQDLIRGISKIIGSQSQQKTVKETVILKGEGNAEALLKRGNLALEEGRWDEADGYFERVLDMDAENALAYLGKLMAELHIHTKAELADQAEPFDDNQNYARVLRFADVGLKDQLEEYNRNIRERNEKKLLVDSYNTAMQKMQSAVSEADYIRAANLFAHIVYYKDSREQRRKCLELAEITRKNVIYDGALKDADSSEISIVQRAAQSFASISGWNDADEQRELCLQRMEWLNNEQEAQNLQKRQHKKRTIIITSVVCAVAIFLLLAVNLLNTVVIPSSKYRTAESLLFEKKYSEAAIAFGKIGMFADAKERSMDLWDKVLQRKKLSTNVKHSVGLLTDGTVIATQFDGMDRYYDGQCEVSEWTDIVEIAAGFSDTVGLKADGTVVFTESTDYLNSSGNTYELSSWRDIVSISTGRYHTVGLKMDGTVVATDCTGFKYTGQCDVSDWGDIVAISAGDYHTVGLKSDGTVVATKYIDNGQPYKGQCEVSEWTDIVAISAGPSHTVGLKADGTVVAVGENQFGQCDVSDWEDIIAIAANSSYHTLGLKSNGTIIATEYTGGINIDHEDRIRQVCGWENIAAIATDDWHTIALKTDGHVVAAGYNRFGCCSVWDWQDIALPNRAGR